MPGVDVILSEEDEAGLTALLTRLCDAARGRAAFLIDPRGRVLAAAGETAGVDATSLAALTAGSLAAAGSLARLVGENEVRALHHEGEKADLYISLAAEGAILLVHFDRRSSLGLVRLRVRGAAREVARAFAEMAERAARDSGRRRAELQAEFSQISETDIDNLFAR